MSHVIRQIISAMLVSLLTLNIPWAQSRTVQREEVQTYPTTTTPTPPAGSEFDESEAESSEGRVFSVKLSPRLVNVVPSPSGEALLVESLLDGDSTTAFAFTAANTVELVFEAPAEIHKVKVFGRHEATLSVLAKTDGGWAPVEDLEKIKLVDLEDGWNSLEPSSPFITSGLRLEWTPRGKSVAVAVGEIEIWQRAPRTLVPNASSLVSALFRNRLPDHVVAYQAATAELTITAGESQRVEIDLDRKTSNMKKAYLAYELSGLSHWASVKRSINDQAPQGGVLSSPVESWSVQVEEVDPAWLLEGMNVLEFSGTDRFEHPFSIRNVRLLVEMDNGANFVEAISINEAGWEEPRQNAHDGSELTSWRPAQGLADGDYATLAFSFDRLTQLDSLDLCLGGEPTGYLEIETLSAGVWSGTSGAISARSLKPGWNSVRVHSNDPVEGVRILLLTDAPEQWEIKELVPVGSGVGAPTSLPVIHLAHPLQGEFQNREVHIRGFVSPNDNGSGRAEILVGPKSVAPGDGSFGVTVSKDEFDLSEQTDDEAWAVPIEARYSDGLTLRRIVKLSRSVEPPESVEGRLLPGRTVSVDPGRRTGLRHDGAKLDFEPGTVESATDITVTPLPEHEIAALDQGMTNVTRGPRRGYRFEPHGMKFSKKLRVELPYNRGLIPPGHTEQDVNTYYFDEQAGRWLQLERAEVNTDRMVVVSLTEHFTDMINATVTVPDHPQPLSFNPTSIKDIKVADPGAGINLIDPPQSNSMGDARLSYPIELPPGRNGLQPDLAISYNSAGGNGWLGMGWDIPMRAVTIDTRWGVPRYDDDPETRGLETETYVLNGEQLTPVAHRGELRPRTAELCEPPAEGLCKTFHTRVEGQFQRIIRHGDEPANYWWEVIDKSGTRFFFGGGPELGGPDFESVLSDPVRRSDGRAPENDIFEWKLREVRDTKGNNIRYHYDVVEGGDGGEPWRKLYLRSIRYTGRPDQEGPYEVVFFREDGRPDVMVDGRPGFKTVTAERLAAIDVRLLNETRIEPLIRRYILTYRTGPFSKSLLARITQYGSDGVTEFNHHDFDYFNEVATHAPLTLDGFQEPSGFSGAQTVSGSGLLNTLAVVGQQSTGLRGDESDQSQTHFYGGVAVGYSKDVSAGVKLGIESSETTTRLTLLDVNGDGLLDQVYRREGGMKFRPNTGGPASAPNFGPELDLPSLDGVDFETSRTRTYGVQGYAKGINGMADKSVTRTRGEVYLSDVNGDLLPDLVNGGNVEFNRLQDGLPAFGIDSPTPLAAGAPSDPSGLVQDPEEGRGDMEERYHLVDPLRRWVAPYNGRVAIAGHVRLLTPPFHYPTADGVRASIQHNVGELFFEELWSVTIAPFDLSPHPIVGLEEITVNAGDRIYFRVNSINDGAFDAVEFDPTITYLDEDLGRTDENGMPIFQYAAGDDFAIGGAPLSFLSPVPGTATLNGDLLKPDVTTDDVTVAVTKQKEEEAPTLVFRQTVAWDETGVFPITVNLATEATDRVSIRLETDSRIDLSGIRFAPTLTYETVNGNPAPVDENGDPALAFFPPVTAQIFPQNHSTAPYSPYVCRSPLIGDVRVEWEVDVSGLLSRLLNTAVTLSIKRPGVRLANKTIVIKEGVIQCEEDQKPCDKMVVNLACAEGDTFYFEADATGPIAVPSAEVSIGEPTLTFFDFFSFNVNRDIHIAIPGEIFGGGFRSWWFGQYNGSIPAVPIIEQLLKFPDDENDGGRQYFVQMIPFPGEERWRAEDEECWISAGQMSASRLRVNYLDFPDGSSFGGGRGVIRYGGARATAVSGSFSSSMLEFGNYDAGIGVTNGQNWSDVDFLDFNGDSYPDVVGGGQVQATLPNGALASSRMLHATLGGPFGHVRQSDSHCDNVNLGATTTRNRSNAGGKLKSISSEQAAYNLSPATELTPPGLEAQGAIGTYRVAHMGRELPETWDLLDINGDGLPDYVRPVAGGFLVQLNLGYRFGAPEYWAGSDTLRSEKSVSLGANLSGGFSRGTTTASYSFGGGLAGTESRAGAEQDLIDVNGDGLVDIVRKDLNFLVESPAAALSVRFNTGSGFTSDEFIYDGALPRPLRQNTTFSVNLGGHLTIAIPILATGTSIILNPGHYRGKSLGGSEVFLTDLDGDGYADHVFSDTDGNVEYALNNHGRTNLLKTVRRPLGAIIELDYARSGNTIEHPQNHWVLSRTSVFDGLAGDGVDHLVTTYSYDGGRYDRAERDFYGFSTVVEEHRNVGMGDKLYRRIVRTFLNTSFYDRGLLQSSLTTDEFGRKFVETINTYDLVAINDGSALASLEEFTETRFPRLLRTDQLFYEGQASPGKSTFTTFDYDAVGNVVRFFDAGDTPSSDNVVADITYFSDTANYIVGKADSIIVRGNGTVMRGRHAVIEPVTGNLRQVRLRLEDGQEAVTDLDYFPNGNLESVEGPANLHDKRYKLTYEYDAVVGAHVTAITDSFGYRSTASYNLKFGLVATSVDLNGNSTSYAYDDFGRVKQITGPYEAKGSDPTIRFDYHPEAVVPYALTQHLDPFRDLNDQIETILFTDGLKRVVQTKKDANVHEGAEKPNPAQVMIVSGRMIFDHVGRTVEQFYPMTETKGVGNILFNPAPDPDQVPPTRTEYDVLDRTTRTTIPDDTSTTMQYGFGTDRSGVRQFETIVTDANEVSKRTYRDVRELITAVKEFNKGGAETIWTSYTYDPLKQIVRVEDDKGNTTTVRYDNYGRRTVIDNPDAGQTETRYDLAGNVIGRITANLRSAGKEITYDYEFNRLRAISYPDFPGSNVTYTYGAPGSGFNRASRVVSVADQSGLEERFYGPLGEIVKEIKTVASFTQGASSNSPEIYTTEYEYDTWNRLQRLTYPDGEVLTYAYDAGGMLHKATGKKGGYTYQYLKRLEYDKFEQRVFIQLGNDVRTTYSYDPLDRRLASLRTIDGHGRVFQNLSYTYDDVGNILLLGNDVPVLPASQFGGPTKQEFAYDELYRLTSSSGSYEFAPDKVRRYGLSMSYDTIHNILAKTQTDDIVQPSGQPVSQGKTTYTFPYAYNASGPASVSPHAPNHIGDRTFTYDANGNQTSWTHDRDGTRRTIVWDEENRIQALFENGHEHRYLYNDAGERVIKRGPQGETVYVNPYFTIRNREVGTKHVFASATRLASKLLKQDKPGGNSSGQVPFEKDSYFYHPDHLGSSNYVTDAQGELYEHIEYFPFGETWVEEASNTQRTPYLFTSKELDEGTGLYYLGARYYDPRVGSFPSGDPMLLSNPEGAQGRTTFHNPYAYAYNSPLHYVDPDGRQNFFSESLQEVGGAGADVLELWTKHASSPLMKARSAILYELAFRTARPDLLARALKAKKLIDTLGKPLIRFGSEALPYVADIPDAIEGIGGVVQAVTAGDELGRVEGWGKTILAVSKIFSGPFSPLISLTEAGTEGLSESSDIPLHQSIDWYRYQQARRRMPVLDFYGQPEKMFLFEVRSPKGEYFEVEIGQVRQIRVVPHSGVVSPSRLGPHE